MANVLGLALKISADASQLKLTPVERALQTLGKETEKVTGIFKQFAGDSDAAATAQQRANRQFVELQEQLKSGAINAQQFAERFGALGDAVEKEADAFRRAAQITEQNRSPQERYQRTVAELSEQLREGRISQETFNRAMQRAQGDLDRTGRSAKQADGQLAAMARQLTTISRIQIGRAIVDGFQVLGGLFRNITGQLQGVITSVSQSIDSINDLSARTDIGVEALQGLGLAAKLSGVDTEQFAVAVTRLGVAIGKADPGGTFDKSLRSINLTLAELRGLSPEQQFAAIGQQISQLPTAAERAAAAVEIFGKQGAALAPLFKAGAASVDEIVARAERLGIVLREDQVANVAELNDTFDLVSATIQGIIGQVVADLSPAVTAVADSFLAFVESFAGVNATGGTALAQSITDVLLTGGEFLAGVFDSFVEQFGGLAGVLETAGTVFQGVGQVFSIVYNGLKVVFNSFQVAIDGFMIALGKGIETLGGYLSTDLEAFGQGLVDASQASLKQNTEELLQAAEGVGTATTNLFSGGNPEQAAAGQAETFMRSLREKIARERSPEFRVESNIEKTREEFDRFFNGIVDESNRVTGLMREFEAAVAAAREDGQLTAEEIAKIEERQKAVNTAIQQELAARAEAVAAAQAQQQADEKRIDALLQTTDATSKITEDLAAVEREIARVQQEIAETGTTGSEDRLNQLQALQGQLEEQLQASAQGFEQGFAKAFEATGNNFARLAEQASEFGQAGFDAAARLQEGIAAAQDQARDGILNREAYEAEVARQQKLFEQEIEQVKQVADERKRVNDFVDQQFNLARFGGDQARLEAANRVAEIEREIIRVQSEVQAARNNGDQAAVAAGIQRLGLLDQVGAKEANIASGRQQLEEQIAKQRDQYLQQLAEQQKKAEEEQKKFAEERAKAVEAENRRQQQRLAELNTLGAGVIQGNDIRTSEGAALFLQLAAQQQDPMLIEARLQTRRLTELRNAAVGIAQTLTGLPVISIPGVQ